MDTLILGVILFSPFLLFALAAHLEPATPETPPCPPDEKPLDWNDWWTGR